MTARNRMAANSALLTDAQNQIRSSGHLDQRIWRIPGFFLLPRGSPLARGRQWRDLRETASIHDPEARQREALGRMVLVDDDDLLAHVVDILRGLRADERRGHERALLELDQRVDVADLVGEARMERHVVPIEREDLAAPACRHPFHVGGERLVLVVDAIGLRPVRRAAGLAAPDQELVLLQALVERLIVLIDVGERLVPRLVRYDDFRFVAHWYLPSNVLVWIEHMPGEISSPPCPEARTTLQSLI